ncbi:YecA family protein [Kurthia sibirica]|uniref:Metal-binding protein n=1 Tax=Kurthia sibirica TaxID=202750 RepID=A0A2U3AKK7_9BACL|nr:SEC-C metal-binding domain-containing protein [Kurthia sibirica]PWI25051.1 metal-binding protein [Kurthia sibirica]GEK34216.1 hypothetical protein KSI01_17490 [Kurthia sibirica]
MIGRNDPCPCGSGKKYKKCCANKEAMTVEAVYEEEVERVLQTFYDKFPLEKDYDSYNEVIEKWHAVLSKYLDLDMVEGIAMDYFFFHEREDIWQDYLGKVIKETIRPTTAKILAQWQSPEMVFAKVISSDERYLQVEDIFSHALFNIRREGDKPVPENVHVFCFILPDDSMTEGNMLAVSSMIFFPTDHQQVFKDFMKTAKGDEKEFWLENAMTLWTKLGENGFVGNEYTDFEAEVFDKVIAYLVENDRVSQELVNLVEDFVVERQPKARKPVAIAAGAIRFGNENDYFAPIDTTIKALAEAFDVSASSMNKYYNEITAYAKTK